MVASIAVTEEDFNAVAGAAIDAKNDGNLKDARALDKVARKMNAALSNQTVSKASPWGRTTGKPSWRDMPSTIGE